MKPLYTLPHAKPTARIMAEQAEARASRARLDELYDQIERSLPSSVANADKIVIEPINARENSNPLRPQRLADVIGQERLKPLLRDLVDSAKASGRPLDHLLFVGASGTGKTTMAVVLGNEIGTRVFAPKAPLDMGVLNALREACRDGDVIFVDEIHMQVSGDRRGITQACDPESFYLLLEDGVLATPTGRLSFPHVTWIGATTDVGLLPEPLSNRFPIQPRLDSYTLADMTRIAEANAKALGLQCDPGVCEMFGNASRRTPRQVNSYMRPARSLARDRRVTVELARRVIEDLCSTTLDGLNESMQIVLRHLYRYCGRETKDGIIYQASEGALASAAGHGRDTKAISLLVEPYLIQQGLLQVLPRGRTLTTAGVERARQLIGGN